MYLEASVPVKVVGLHHPWTFVQNVSRGFNSRECGGIASSLNFCSKFIQRIWSTWMWWDFIIHEILFKMYLEASVPVNVVGLHHPWTSIQNVSKSFSPCECGGIASSLKIYSKCIQRLRSPWMWWYCIIPELLFRMYLEISVPMNVVGLHHPWT